MPQNFANETNSWFPPDSAYGCFYAEFAVAFFRCRRGVTPFPLAVRRSRPYGPQTPFCWALVLAHQETILLPLPARKAAFKAVCCAHGITVKPRKKGALSTS
jgi:hypothetical protein